MANLNKNSEVCCSFCGKSEPEVKKLVAGPNGIYICDQIARDNVPTKISQLVNDANYANETYVINKISEASPHLK